MDMDTHMDTQASHNKHTCIYMHTHVTKEKDMELGFLQYTNWTGYIYYIETYNS